jgi:hypothetical protein
MASKNVLTIAAKMVGGRAIMRESDEVASGIGKVGKAAEKADKQAGSTKGWQVFSKQQKEVAKTSKEHTRSLHSAVGTAIKYAAGYAGISGAVGLAKSSISDFQSTAEEVRQAHSLGLGGTDQQTLVMLTAYKQRGVGMQQLAMSAKGMAKASYAATREEEKFNAAQAKAIQTGKASNAELGAKAKSFQALGINVQQFAKMSGTEQLKAVSSAMEKMPAGPERTRIATELLGRSAQKMLPMFTKGALGINSMEKAAKMFLPTFKGGTKGFEEMEAAQLRLGLATEGLKLRIGMALLPVVLKIMKAMTKLYDAVSHGRGVWKDVGKVIHSFALALKGAAEWVKHSVAAQKVLLVVLGLLAVAWAVEKVKKFVMLIKSLWLIQKLVVVVTKAWTIAQAAFNLVMDANPIAIAVLAIVALIAVFVLAYKKVTWFREAVKSVWNWIKHNWPILAGILLGPFAFAAIEVIKHWHQVVHFFEKLPGVLASVFEGIGSMIANVFKGVINFAIIGPIDALLHGAHMLYRKIPDPLGVLPSWPLSDPAIPKLAKGGIVKQGGSVIVGEKGPEWLTLPQGARVDPLAGRHDHGGLLGAFSAAAGGGGGDMHVHVEIAGREVAQAVLKEFRRLEARAA